MTCSWEPEESCLGERWTSLSDDIKDRALMFATSALQGLTLNRVGTCPITIRPGPPVGTCAHYRGVSALVPPFPFNPHMEADGLWYNSCGCQAPCSPLSEVDIPGPVGYIESLRVNGTDLVLDNGDWRMDDGHLLVWQGEGDSPIPSIQNLSKPDTEDGTWSITYSQSYPVAEDGRIAVALLAMEMAEACKPKGKCSLPRGVTNVIRSGVTFTISAGLFPGGLTDIELVDVFILKWAPAGSPLRNAVVMDPRSIHTRPRVTAAVPMPRISGSS